VINDVSLRPASRRDRALTALDQIRALVTDGDLPDAIQKLDSLRTTLAEWQDSLTSDINGARSWLDKALSDDLLLFNVETAKRYLDQWANASTRGEDRELEYYRKQVNDRTRQKQAALQARGVVAHCEELWKKASELEMTEQPAHPDFLLPNYYTKARDITAAAYAEYPDNADLGVLMQKAERLRGNKTLAAQIYRMAVGEEKYSEAIRELAKLTDTDLIPRYQLANDGLEQDFKTVERMISVINARTDLNTLARNWAVKKGGELLYTVEQHLAAHQPQAALDAVRKRPAIDEFLSTEERTQIQELERQAESELRKLEHAERRARQAITLAAWDVYQEARGIYEWSPVVEEAKQALVAELGKRLEQVVVEAEQAFVDKQMPLVQQLCQNAQRDYAGKDPSLDEWLNRLNDLDWQAGAYQEYLRDATAALDEIKQLLWQDASAASDLLAQLETSYHEMILADLPDLSTVRVNVRARLAAEATYNRLYTLMFSQKPEEIQPGIDSIASSDDPQLRQLGEDLELHLTFIQARTEAANGDYQKAFEMMLPVASAMNHPNQQEARTLISEYREKLKAV
jgi:hypothetical protein